MTPRQSVFDARTESIRARFETGRPDLATLPLATLGARFVATGSLEGKPSKSSLVTLKLVLDPGAEENMATWIHDRSGEVISSGERVLVANLDVKEIDALQGVSGLRRVEAPQEFHLTLESARGVATGLDDALRQPGAPTGNGVVIGVIDTGVDWSHPDFLTPDGESRLELFVYAHRLANSLHSERQEYSKADIDAAIKAVLNNRKSSVPKGDPNGHGTHCASIAAGNGAASGGRLRGVAPNATLMAVRSEPLLDAHIIEGIRRIFSLAGDRPAVVNLSLGGHIGPHDGTSALESAIARETGPGRIVVVAAGNEGEDQIHWSGKMRAGQDLIIPFRIVDTSSQFVDVWIPRGDEVAIVIVDPDGVEHIPDSQTHLAPSGELTADWRVDQVNFDQNLTVLVTGGSSGSRWQIRITPARVTQGEVHAWAGTADPAAPQSIFPTGDSEYTIGIPGTEERAIVVGSFVSRAQLRAGTAGANPAGLQVGHLSPFSSRGPTRIGKQRPDITAPGQFVTAALASGCELARDPRLANRREGQYITIQGTSMATPFVSGVVALMLQLEPKLDPSEIQRRLRATAHRDEIIGPVWNSGFGYGRIDVAQLLKYAGGFPR